MPPKFAPIATNEAEPRPSNSLLPNVVASGANCSAGRPGSHLLNTPFMVTRGLCHKNPVNMCIFECIVVHLQCHVFATSYFVGGIAHSVHVTF